MADKKKVVIIGGGTAGLTIANQLSPYFEVEVLECSKNKNVPIIYRIPLLIGLLFSKNNKWVKNIQLKNVIEKKIPFYISNVLGGASVINGCVHVFGSKENWEKILNKFKIPYKNLSFAYDKIYGKNLIKTRSALSRNIDDALFESLKSLGYKKNSSVFADSEGYSNITNTIGNIFRSSVHVFLNNKFKVKLETKVERLIIKSDKKYAVELSDGEIKEADYIIMAAGVVGTNEILIKSKNHLPKKILKDIGKNIGDHTNLRINVKSSKKINSLNEINSSVLKKLILGFKHIIGFKTIMSGTGATSSIHLDLDNDGIIDTRINLLNFYEDGRAGSSGELFNSKTPGFSFSITPINPVSRGNIQFKNGELTINPNYFSNEQDYEIVRRAIKLILEIINQYPLCNYVECIEKENEIMSSLDDYIRNYSYSGYHLIGGTDKIIDDGFKIMGTENIFVCDASTFSIFPASNIHSSVVLLSYLFSEKFINNEK